MQTPKVNGAVFSSTHQPQSSQQINGASSPRSFSFACRYSANALPYMPSFTNSSFSPGRIGNLGDLMWMNLSMPSSRTTELGDGPIKAARKLKKLVCPAAAHADFLNWPGRRKQKLDIRPVGHGPRLD